MRIIAIENTLSTLKEKIPDFSNSLAEIRAKSLCCFGYQLLQLGFSQSQRSRSESKLDSTVGKIAFERMDISIPGSKIKNLTAPTVNSEGLLAALRGKFYRSLLNASSHSISSGAEPDEFRDASIAHTHKELSNQWGILKLIRALPDVPQDLLVGALRGDRLAGILSGESLFTHYLRRIGEYDFVVEMETLQQFPTKSGYERLGFKAELRFIDNQLLCHAIHLSNKTILRPNSSSSESNISIALSEWQKAQDIAMASLVFDVIANRHLLAMHLINVAMIGHFRNTLEIDHPIARLLEPHTVGTIGIHFSQVPLLIGHFSFLSHVFPYEQHTINDILSALAQEINYADYDIEAFIVSRNMHQSLPFKTPFQDYQLDLYRTYRSGVQAYVNAAYSSDEVMQKDNALLAFLDAWSNQVLPTSNHSINAYLQGRSAQSMTRNDLTKLLTNYLFFTTVSHEAVGNGFLQYALQGHLMPVAVTKNNYRMSFKRYLNLASILLWTSLPKNELGSFFEKVVVPESATLERYANELWNTIRLQMHNYCQDSRLPGAGAPEDLERSVNQ